ncbi:hypothetical protein V5O48_005080 [Marasmius crinis-equi]|uniref:Uncharacterized protein n=1 Tax=Marasmius crinis-equi TaxID=585013 RepID=A0ABR3FP11_9AGAR
MTIEEPPPMFDDDFQKDCLRRHPTARIALGELRKQGKPPKPSHFDLSSPSPRVNAVIEIMGSLAANLQKTAGGDGGLATQIMNDWTSLLGPWVKFFLEDFILADEEPYTPEGALALERVLTVIPGSFTSLYKPAEPRFLALKHLSPFFVPCITQVTFKLMDEAHPKWVLWSSLLSDMFMDDSEPTHGIDYLPRRVLYSFEEPSLGLLFVRHINHLTPRVRVMSKSEMTVLSNLVALVDNMETNPLHLTSVREEAIPALIRLASAVLLKRKLSPRTSPDGIYNNVHALATVAMKQLAIILREPRFVFQALEADLVQVILKIPRYVFQCDDRGPDSTERLIHWVSMILDNISRLMINTSVFRRLLARVRRVTAEDSLEARVRGSSEVVWERWERTKKKVVMLHEWRESIKNDGLVLCANHEVRVAV